MLLLLLILTCFYLDNLTIITLSSLTEVTPPRRPRSASGKSSSSSSSRHFRKGFRSIEQNIFYGTIQPFQDEWDTFTKQEKEKIPLTPFHAWFRCVNHEV